MIFVIFVSTESKAIAFWTTNQDFFGIRVSYECKTNGGLSTASTQTALRTRPKAIRHRSQMLSTPLFGARGENRKKNTGEIQNEFYCILANLFKELQTSHFHHMFVIAYFKKSLNSTDFHLFHHFGAKALQLSFAQCSQFQGLELQMKSIEVWEGGRKVDVIFHGKIRGWF